jgi:Tetracyclin repressor-like, C-terminal domain/Bacterial regulatory proteins, tetR family
MEETTRKPDRRAERSRQAILDATRQLLAQPEGVRSLTVEAVAARAGVAKTIIYRRWRDKWGARAGRGDDRHAAALCRSGRCRRHPHGAAHRQLQPVIQRGIARGNLRADTDLPLLHELLLGRVFYRLLLSGGALDHKLSTRIVDAVLKGFAPASGADREPQRRQRRRASRAAASS